MHAKQQSANYETNIDRTKRKNNFTKIIGNFNALFTDKTSRKRSVNHGELGQYYKPTKFIKYMYRTLYPTAADYLGQTPSFNKFKGTELYQHTCSLTTVK